MQAARVKIAHDALARKQKASTVTRDGFSTDVSVGPSRSLRERRENPSPARARVGSIDGPDEQPAGAGWDSYNAMRTTLRTRSSETNEAGRRVAIPSGGSSDRVVSYS